VSEEQEPKQRDPDTPVFSPWFPRAGTGGHRASQVSGFLGTVKFEPRSDPDPDLAVDGYMEEEVDGKVIRYLMQILHMPEEGLEARLRIDGGSPA
jgi:hypothetical protein